MFFWISKLLAPFQEPVPYVFLLIIAALIWRRKPRLMKGCLLSALVVLIVFGTDPFPNLLLRRLERRYPRPKTPPQADAIIVLAGMVSLDISNEAYIEFGDPVDRMLAGISLLKEGYGDVLIITGGSGSIYDQKKREAALLRQFAIDFGVPADKLLIEADSRNTYENAVQTKAMMEQRGLSSSILITSASHLPRAVGCFRKLGMGPIPYPVDFAVESDHDYHIDDFVPNVDAFKKSSIALHEYIGILTYKLAGYM